MKVNWRWREEEKYEEREGKLEREKGSEIERVELDWERGGEIERERRWIGKGEREEVK